MRLLFVWVTLAASLLYHSCVYTDETSTAAGITDLDISTELQDDVTTDITTVASRGPPGFDPMKCYRKYRLLLNDVELLCRCMFFIDPCKRPYSPTYYDIQDKKTWEKNKQEYYILIAVYSLGWVIGVSGNILVIVSVAVYLRKDSATNVYLAGLAVADLILVFVCFPAKLLDTVLTHWVLGRAMCLLINFFREFSWICSSMTLALISVERYMAICNPMKAQRVTSVGRSRALIGVVWFISILLAAPNFYIMDLNHRHRNLDTGHYLCGLRKTKTDSYKNPVVDELMLPIYNIALFIVAFYIPFILIATMYTLVSRTLWISAKTAKSMQGSGSGDGNPKDSKLQKDTGRTSVIKMLIGVVITFFACWFPFVLYKTYTTFEAMDDVHETKQGGTVGNSEEVKKMKAITTYLEMLAYFNSLMNPILYALVSSQFRGVYAAIIRCQCSRLKSGTFSSAASSSGISRSRAATSMTTVSTVGSSGNVSRPENQNAAPPTGVSTEQVNVSL